MIPLKRAADEIPTMLHVGGAGIWGHFGNATSESAFGIQLCAALGTTVDMSLNPIALRLIHLSR